MNELRMFNSPEFGEVRVITGADNEPKFCLVDVCQTLGLNPSKIAQRLTDDVLSKYPIADALGRKQENNFVNEDGLYDVTTFSSFCASTKLWMSAMSRISYMLTKDGLNPFPCTLTTPAQGFRACT